MPAAPTTRIPQPGGCRFKAPGRSPKIERTETHIHENLH